MAQYPARTGPIQNNAAAITIDMLQGCRPAERSHARVSRSAMFGTPDVAVFPNDSVIGWHPDSPRLPKNARGASFFPWSGTTATNSPEMFAGNLPTRPRAAVAHAVQLFGTPDVSPFSIESIFASRPDRPRVFLGPKIGQPLSQPTHTAAPVSVEMFAFVEPDRTTRRVPHWGDLTAPPEVDLFSIEMVAGNHPDKPRIMLGPRIGQPVSQTTHTNAPITLDMLQGVTAPMKRYIAPRHDGWQWVTPEVPVFSIEMVVGSHPDKPRLLLGQPAGQPIGETDTIIPPPPPPPPVDTGATPGWPGSDDTPGYERGKSQGWINRDYIRQPSQRPTRRVKPVPPPEPPVARPPLVRVPYVPQGPPMRVQARVVGGTGGVGQAVARLGMVATVVVRPAAGMVAQARSTKVTRKMTPAEWFALKMALSDD